MFELAEKCSTHIFMLTPKPQLLFSVKEWSALAATVMAARMMMDLMDNIADVQLVGCCTSRGEV